MRYLTFILFLVTLQSFGQEPDRKFAIAEVFHGGDSIFIKKLLTQVVYIGEGTVTKMQTPPDTAKLFIASDGGIYNGVIVWHKVGAPPVDPPIPLYDTIDSAPSQQIFYGGTWTHASVNGHHKNTISFSATANSFIEFTNVTGRQISLYFERKSTHGMAEIILNGVAHVPLIDLYTSTKPELKKQLLYSVMLNPGLNTIRIRVTGAKNPASTFQWVVFDFATVMK